MPTSALQQIGFGGSCHWCTEAIFRSLKGVSSVSQGWISPAGEPDAFSEAVIVYFDPGLISLETLIEIHLYTHSCTSEHSMRPRYRSAVYAFSREQAQVAVSAIRFLQMDFNQPIITQVLDFGLFRLNKEQYLDYYYSNPDKPFCRRFIEPKLKIFLKQFSNAVRRAGSVREQ